MTILNDLADRLLRFDILLTEERAITRQILDMPPDDPDILLLEEWREAGLRVACCHLSILGAVIRNPATRGEALTVVEAEIAKRHSYRAETQEMADRATARIKAAAKPAVDFDRAAE